MTEDGRLLGVVMVCGHHIDGGTLYVDNADVDKQVTVGEWTADRPLGPGLSTWTLDTPAEGWATTTALTPLSDRTTYTFYGWTKANSWSARPVSFTLAERNRLAPGTVLYDTISDSGDESTVTVSMADFTAKACHRT
ncbi:hypothetical protein EAO71_00885 [Streptomyces sp. ms191]|nr:hypothetical protein EAO71_00885 [Streptomyces sp. ms191]